MYESICAFSPSGIHGTDSDRTNSVGYVATDQTVRPFCLIGTFSADCLDDSLTWTPSFWSGKIGWTCDPKNGTLTKCNRQKKELVPLGRFSTPEEQSYMTLLLLDNVMGGYMTGQEYFVE